MITIKRQDSETTYSEHTFADVTAANEFVYDQEDTCWQVMDDGSEVLLSEPDMIFQEYRADKDGSKYYFNGTPAANDNFIIFEIVTIDGDDYCVHLSSRTLRSALPGGSTPVAAVVDGELVWLTSQHYDRSEVVKWADLPAYITT